MQTGTVGNWVRCLILVAVMAAGTALHQLVGRPVVAGTPRWPAAELLAVDGWTSGAVQHQEAWGVHHLRRAYTRPDGVVATVILSTNTRGKGVYTDAAVPLAGSGYAVAPAPAALVGARQPAPWPGRRAVLARGEGRVWLMLYGYGERRGLLGNGVPAWAAVFADAALGRPNDYFQLRVLVPLEGAPDGTPVGGQPSAAAGAASDLGDTLIARVAAWYGA